MSVSAFTPGLLPLCLTVIAEQGENKTRSDKWQDVPCGWRAQEEKTEVWFSSCRRYCCFSQSWQYVFITLWKRNPTPTGRQLPGRGTGTSCSHWTRQSHVGNRIETISLALHQLNNQVQTLHVFSSSAPHARRGRRAEFMKTLYCGFSLSPPFRVGILILQWFISGYFL